MKPKKNHISIPSNYDNQMRERNNFGDLLNKLVRRNQENFPETLIEKPQKISGNIEKIKDEFNNEIGGP